MASEPDTAFNWKMYQKRYDEMEGRAAREAELHLGLLDQYDLIQLFDLFELPEEEPES